VFGFAGNGTPGAQDAVGQQRIVAETNISTTGITTIQLDPAFVRSLAGNASHLGLTIVPETVGAFGFETLETGQFGEPPLLTINLGPEAMLLAGDFNDDGFVDAADYTLWRDNLGSATALANDDSPGVGQDDYDVWRSHFGETKDSGSAATAHEAVPEPTSLIVLALSSIALPFRRRR
jgi:hypothetical protein